MMKDRRILALVAIFLLLLLTFQFLRSPQKVIHLDIHRSTIKSIREEISSYHPPPYRIFHLDLKGAPPKISYLREIFPLVREAGGNALLVEYEDMFPYTGMLSNASALNAFTPSQIKEIVSIAEENELKVIPLIQTFGHMEHVLKLSEFVALREIPSYPQSLCPSKWESFQLVVMMIDQLLSLHPNVEYLHIGCDEVYHMGICSKCSDRIRRSKTSSLFIDHLLRISSYILTKHPHVKPIVWDDMLRNLPENELKVLKNAVEPMVWVYVEDIYHFVGKSTWRKYSNVFPHIWAASAFKGAYGERLFLPNISRHFKNHLSWRRVLQREGSYYMGRKLQFRGIALTGWSRYDHFAVLCELLPPSIPSLILNLVLMSFSGPEEVILKKVQSIIKCNQLETSNLEPESFEDCSFPGVDILLAMLSFQVIKAKVESLDTDSRYKQGWLTSYNVKYNFTSPWRISETMRNHISLPNQVKDFKLNMESNLKKIYEESTVLEWTEQNVSPLQDKLDNLIRTVRELSYRNTWQRRPFC
ncbi:hexosaminidase D [Lepeophtheirus salmonis]|uniref:beta-N-acetylhexosaminidase n=1 Tax=Lepeophtheirus salmonis TaxID=72036 RepID=A0A0K2TF20_LEPSM|nr:hexosaminidase D-like [Lepeophtheirus salmonis]